MILLKLILLNSNIDSNQSEINTKYPQAKEYKEAGDMPNYAILVHSIKSDSKYLGFTKLAELAYEHELKSKDNDIDFVNSNFTSLEDEINRIINIVKTYLGKE